MARRIQLSRAKGWRLPEGAVSVARPGRWGNPYKIGAHLSLGAGNCFSQIVICDAERAVALFRNMLRHPDRNYPSDSEIRAELAGKDLACWCKPGEPCNADVLIDLANRPREG